MVVIMHEEVVRDAFMHHADPQGVYKRHKVGMMLKCSHGELPTRTALVHTNDKGFNA